MELNLKASKLFQDNYQPDARVSVNQGGTSSGKTWAILQVIMATAHEENCLISIVSESLPHLKKGCERDFKNMLLNLGLYNDDMHNKTDHVFSFGNSMVEFFGADQPDKVRGPRRDYLFINECNNVPYETFDQLEIRTKKKIWLDFNPVAEFWAHTEVLPRDDAKLIKSTYKDNPFLEQSIVDSIEKRKHNKNWWRVFGEGEIGIYEGLVYDNWEIVDEAFGELDGYGFDFGYSNSPSTIVECYIVDEDTICLHEILYHKGLTNEDIYNAADDKGVDFMKTCIADSEDPKSIEELYRMGWRMIKPAEKPKGSVNSGIQLLQGKRMMVTKTSVNLIKELRNYRWAVDKWGNKINKPEKDHDHALDAIRYWALIRLGAKKEYFIM